ncbi:MAG: septum formation initiator family protein [Solobacterium sp.]|nr:septum formation initiator family protein [Solobacterium sp.]
MTQTQKVKTKKKKRRKMTPIMKLLCLIMIGASFFLLYQVGREVYTTVTLRHDITEAEEKYQKILDESAYLSSEREKLTDPNYVQSYARGNYMLSKDGEQIFYLPEKDK